MPDRFLLFYKPYDVLSQFSEQTDSSASSLKAFIPVSNVYPVGRLDRDSEGLLLLTNNGRVQHCLSDPKFQHPRTYWVQVERIPTAEALQTLRQGLVIQNYRSRPAQVQLIDPPELPPRHPPIRYRKNIPTAWIELVLTEGKNRQVRRMTAAVGFPTLRLVRAAISDLSLAGLQPGEWRDLTAIELKKLMALVT